MNVRSIFRPWVVRVDGRDCLADAAERMQNEQVGSVVVAIGGRFVGILTERDLTRAIAEEADPRDVTAAAGPRGGGRVRGPVPPRTDLGRHRP